LAEIRRQYQTKVETAAKYRARLYEFVADDVFHNVGRFRQSDIPDYAQPVAFLANRQGQLGALLCGQSEIGLDVRTHPSLTRKVQQRAVRFWRRIPTTNNGVNFGIARHADCESPPRLGGIHQSFRAGFVVQSPLSPTSFARLQPRPLAYAGNLWGWTPQLRVEHRFNLSDQTDFNVPGRSSGQSGLGAPLNSFYRSAQAGENSGQPAYALRSA